MSAKGEWMLEVCPDCGSYMKGLHSSQCWKEARARKSGFRKRERKIVVLKQLDANVSRKAPTELSKTKKGQDGA